MNRRGNGQDRNKTHQSIPKAVDRVYVPIQHHHTHLEECEEFGH